MQEHDQHNLKQGDTQQPAEPAPVDDILPSEIDAEDLAPPAQVAPDAAEVTPEEGIEEDGLTYADRGDAKSVFSEYPVFKALNGEWDENAPTMNVPAASGAEVKKVLSSLSQTKQQSLERNTEWVEVTGDALFHTPRADFHSELDDRPGSKFEQVLRREDGRVMTIAKPPIHADTDMIVSGAQAIARLNGLLSIGGTYRIPLWHSGFWITLRAPSDAKLIELDRMMTEEKISLGRQTSGLLYSNESVFQLARLVNFALDHLESCTLKDSSRANILEQMDAHDAQALAWGLACTIWPNGFQYARAVLGKTEAEHKVIKGLINVSKMQYIDTAQITDKQNRHMARVKEGCMTNEEVATYKQQFRNRERQIVIDDNVRLNLHVPSIAEHINRGQAWVNSIVINNDRVFGMDQDEGVRNSYLNQQANSTILRQYGHWVKSVELGKGVTKEGDVDTVDDLLDRLSQSDEYRTKIMNEIIQYCEDTTFSFIGVPTVNDIEEQGKPANRKHVLGVDIFAYFFTLHRAKLQQIATRNLSVMYA